MLNHNRFRIMALALGVCGTSCSFGQGEGEGGSDGAGVDDQDNDIPGAIVSCGVDPETETPKLVCVREDDPACSHRDYYVVRSHCARTFGGLPADYIGQWSLHSISDGDEESNYCDVGKGADGQPDGVLQTQATGGIGCHDCRVCGDQLAGYNASFHDEDWITFDWCPDNYEDLEVFCGEDWLGGDDDQASTGPDDDNDGVWRCNGSWLISGTMWDSFGSEEPTEDHIYMAFPSKPVCVAASDSASAVGECIDRCQLMNASYQTEANYSMYKEWEPFPCADLNLYEPTPPFDIVSECANGGPALIGEPMVASASLEVFEGGAAAVAGVGGIVDATIEVCAATKCPARVDALEIGPRTLTGEYVAKDGTAVEYTLEGVHVELQAPMLGVWSEEGGLEFPEGRASFTLSADSVVFGGLRAGRIAPVTVVADLRDARRLRDGGVALEFIHKAKEGSLRLRVQMDGSESP